MLRTAAALIMFRNIRVTCINGKQIISVKHRSCTVLYRGKCPAMTLLHRIPYRSITCYFCGIWRFVSFTSLYRLRFYKLLNFLCICFLKSRPEVAAEIGDNVFVSAVFHHGYFMLNAWNIITWQNKRDVNRGSLCSWIKISMDLLGLGNKFRPRCK